MARKLLPTLFSLLHILSLLSLAQTQTPPQLPPSTACKSTPFPSFCRTLLPNTTANSSSSSTVHDYGRFSLRKSLSASTKFLSLVEKHLRNSKAGLSVTAVRALEDCKFLAQCNVDDLTASSRILGGTYRTLSPSLADDVQTLLSAVLTNVETCMDGIQATASAWSVREGILSPLSNDTRLFSVSLALFKRGWVPNRTRKSSVHSFIRKKYLKRANGSLNLKMSEENKAIYRTINNNNNNNRRLLQTDDISSQVLVSDIVVVSQDGTWNFTSITDAVNAAPNNTNGSNGYFLIYITAGVYEEYVVVPKYKKYLMMVGDGVNETVITGNHSVVDGWTTFNSSSFAVVGTGFFAVGITFRNTAGPAKHQAVAVRNGADLSTFHRCSFEGYQDTLYVHSLRQFYSECDVSGTVDFIFGNAAAVFQTCTLRPRLPLPGQFNAITAQGRTDPNQNTGISIHNCTVRAADDLAASANPVRTYLGRPWKEYSRTVYMQSFIDGVVAPSGWSAWSGDFGLNTSYYAEFGNFGPGADTGRRVTWPGFRVIDAGEAANFTVSAFVLGDDWVPQTGIGYTGGLL